MRRIIYQAAKVLSLTLLAVQVVLTIGLLAGTLTGHQIMVVTGGSMEPTYHLGSAVLLDVSHRTPAVGDVITFTSSNQVVVTHRVISLHDHGGEMFLQTKGDANAAPDKDLVSAKNVLGEPGPSAPWIGYAINFLTSPVGKLVTLGPVLVLIAAREIWKGHASYRQAQARRQISETLDWVRMGPLA